MSSTISAPAMADFGNTIVHLPTTTTTAAATLAAGTIAGLTTTAPMTASSTPMPGAATATTTAGPTNNNNNSSNNNNTTSLSASSTRPRKRRRPAVVCAECRRRKIACDRKTPCGQCALHNVECVYVTGSMPPPYGRSLRTPTSPGAQQSLSMDSSIGSSAGASNVANSANSSSNSILRTPGSAVGPDGEIKAMDNHDASSLEEDVPTDETNRMLASLGERSSRFGGRLAKTRLFGRSHWVNNMDQFKEVHNLNHLVRFVNGSPIYKSMKICKTLGKLIKADEKRRIQQPLAEDESTWYPPFPRAVTDRLFDLYFLVFEPQFRVLHLPTFRREYQQFLDSGGGSGSGLDPPTTDIFVTKLVLVLALGSCFYKGPDHEDVHSTLRVACAQAVRKMNVATCTPLDKHDLNMDTMQLYCLVTIARQTTALELGDDLTWFTTGSLLHTAFGMGYNRDPSNFKSLSFFQGEMRRRLWATVLELVLQSSLDQGMPPLVSDDDYDCLPPSNLDDDQIDTESTTTTPHQDAGKRQQQQPIGQPDSVFTHTRIQRLLCRSLPVRLRIAKALNGLGTSLSYERALRLSSELMDACRYSALTFKTAQHMVPTASAAEAASFSRLRVAFFELLTRRFHHSLHSPFARKAGSNVQFFFSRRARIETALKMMAFFRPANSPVLTMPPDALDAFDPCWRFLVSGRGLIKCTLVEVQATITMEMMLQLQESFVPGADLTVSQRELFDSVRATVKLTRARIEEGETNVRGHAFFCGALAQIEAILDGRPVRPSILEAAQICVEELVSILRGIAARKHVALPDDLDSLVKDASGGGDSGNHNDMASSHNNSHSHNRNRNHISNNASDNGSSGHMTVSPSALRTKADAEVEDVENGLMDGTLPMMTDMLSGSISFSQMEADAAAAAAAAAVSSATTPGLGLSTADSSMTSGGDVDSAIHLSATDISAATSSNSGGAWTDEWIMDPPGDFGYGNWFFPANERIGSDGP